MSIDDVIAADGTDYDAIFNAEQNRSPNAMFEAEYVTPQALLMQLEERNRHHWEMVRQHDAVITTLQHRLTSTAEANPASEIQAQMMGLLRHRRNIDMEQAVQAASDPNIFRADMLMMSARLANVVQAGANNSDAELVATTQRRLAPPEQNDGRRRAGEVASRLPGLELLERHYMRQWEMLQEQGRQLMLQQENERRQLMLQQEHERRQLMLQQVHERRRVEIGEPEQAVAGPARETITSAEVLAEYQTQLALLQQYTGDV